MRITSILYHDVVPPGGADSSGFPGPAAARYKLEVSQFERHLKAIQKATVGVPGTIFQLLSANYCAPALVLTFDDGGNSALKAAEMLDRIGWRGHFFITTDHIGQKGFLNTDELRELRERGHVVGSHSCSHPERMAACSWQQMLREWSESVHVLSDLLGETVSTASVPRGSYSRKVAQAAAASGIKFLFTSEPMTRTGRVDGCLILGRYTIYRGTPPSIAAGFATGHWRPRLQQMLYWNLKKAVKRMGGDTYLRLRRTRGQG
jgi:peptidoglycan/xylan/chitin deacetylase (PgdA/CDA1 family)